jgi:hypothetical protein
MENKRVIVVGHGGSAQRLIDTIGDVKEFPVALARGCRSGRSLALMMALAELRASGCTLVAADVDKVPEMSLSTIAEPFKPEPMVLKAMKREYDEPPRDKWGNFLTNPGSKYHK